MVNIYWVITVYQALSNGLFPILKQVFEMNSIIIFILQMKELRHREAKKFPKVTEVVKGETKICLT